MDEKSEALIARVKPYLKSSESILWVGKPIKNLVYLPFDVFSIILGAFWLAFSTFWLIISIGPAIEQGADASVKILPFISIPFFFFGLWSLIIKNLTRLKSRKQIIYVVTNKRILTILPDKGYAEQYIYSDIARITVKEDKNGNGSVFFFSGKDTKKKISTSGIFGVEKIKDLMNIIEERLRKKG